MLQRQDLPMPVINSIAAAEDEMTAWRRAFHMHPELGFEGLRTSETVAHLLARWGLEVPRGIAGTGVVGPLRGSAPGRGSRGLGSDGRGGGNEGVRAGESEG